MIFFGVVMFGQNVPDVLVAVAIALLFVGYLLVDRGSAHRVGFVGTGEMHQCDGCGRNFQPERIERMDDGSERRFIDERCPRCGKDEDSSPRPHFPV